MCVNTHTHPRHLLPLKSLTKSKLISLTRTLWIKIQVQNKTDGIRLGSLLAPSMGHASKADVNRVIRSQHKVREGVC